ncbi:MAG: hypothetical protein HY695_24930 [Deltaproteobacteria bacterium]|nr:hypothetical protein [Deltaproteobacteria bacterium]
MRHSNKNIGCGSCKRKKVSTRGSQKESCNEFRSLLVRKIVGEILPHEKRELDVHLAQCLLCATEEREFSTALQRFGSLPDPEIPAELYEKTRQTILGYLREEKIRQK